MTLTNADWSSPVPEQQPIYSTIKVCYWCKHSYRIGFSQAWICKAPQMEPKIDLVTGNRQYPLAAAMRREAECCGEEARWFEQWVPPSINDDEKMIRWWPSVTFDPKTYADERRFSSVFDPKAVYTFRMKFPPERKWWKRLIAFFKEAW